MPCVPHENWRYFGDLFGARLVQLMSQNQYIPNLLQLILITTFVAHFSFHLFTVFANPFITPWLDFHIVFLIFFLPSRKVPSFNRFTLFIFPQKINPGHLFPPKLPWGLKRHQMIFLRLSRYKPLFNFAFASSWNLRYHRCILHCSQLNNISYLIGQI